LRENNMQILNNGWIRKGSVIGFPHYWQYPAKTEEWVYESLTTQDKKSKFVEFIAFPWATLIDLLNRGKYEKANKLISALDNLPPKTTLIRASACQHINIKTILYIFEKIKLTDLFWAHKIENENEIYNIRLHPMALYPVAYYYRKNLNIKPFSQRKYLYSFIGAHDEGGYISKIREKIFDLPINNYSVIVKRHSWHFEKQVYGEQIQDVPMSLDEINISKMYMNQYIDVMLESQYCLCPSGSGPNSIRLWESLAFNTSPIVLSDGLDLPENIKKIGLIKIKENNLNKYISDLIFKDSVKDIYSKINVNDFIKNITHDLFDNNFIIRK